MIYFFYFLHVLISLFLIMVVLLQQGKGADLSVFGGGGTMTAFGARGAATLLHKLTVGAFVGFIFTTLVIGVMQGQATKSTVMSGVEVEAEAEEVVEQEAPAALLEEDAPATESTEAAPAATDAEASDASVTDDGASADAPSGDASGDGDTAANSNG